MTQRCAPASTSVAQIGDPRGAGVLSIIQVNVSEALKIGENGVRSPPAELAQQFEELVQLGKLENEQVELLKLNLGRTCTESGTQVLNQLDKSLGEILEKKRLIYSKLCTYGLEGSTPTSALSTLGSVSPSLLSIATQPADIAVVNRYLIPTPVVSVSPDFNAASNNKFSVSVRLLYHPGDTLVEKDILQGIKNVSVTPGGRAVFSKLKVTEVSSKHAHQSFSLEFVLESENSSGNDSIYRVTSSPFHVQSRSTKRKRSDAFDSKDSPVTSHSIPVPENENAETASLPQNPSVDVELRGTRALNSHVDITELLTLPQKDAARRLGISESMLCKRFKECTRRKWPYRSLRKIDKMINIYQLRQANGVLPEEDSGKLQQLVKERQEWLMPVQIRITSSDRVSPPLPTTQPAPLSDLDEDIPFDALETLEMLRMGVRDTQESEKDVDQALDQLKLLKHLAPLVYTSERSGREDEVLPSSDPSSPLSLRPL